MEHEEDLSIESLRFTKEDLSELSGKWYGNNWPVVYVLRNDKEAYIGESTAMHKRIKQHLDNDIRHSLKIVDVITHPTFNKSAVLDIESKLIEYISADGVYQLQNNNGGIKNHEYYQKDQYLEIFKNIWEKLKMEKTVINDLRTLENSDLFKYSPYKTLSEEQYEVIFKLANDLFNSIANQELATFMISGEAGTGKTVMAMYLLKLISDNKLAEMITEGDDLLLDQFNETMKNFQSLKIALVVPMGSLRATLKKVVSKISGLKSSMVISPVEATKEEYDILMVDEAHRLNRRQNIVNYRSFDQTNEKLNLGNEGNQLDWIMTSSKYQILFYDSRQSVRPSDVRVQDFRDIQNQNTFFKYKITSQLRSLGGNDYMKYIDQILSNNPPAELKVFGEFEFELFDSIALMREKILSKNQVFGLSRMIAGYGWEWKTKNFTYKEIEASNTYDIEIQNEKFIWNKTSSGWINSENAIKEVGSIHTTQGYDLNFAGIIFGPEIGYDIELDKIIIYKDSYKDKNGKNSILNDFELEQYIINIYKVLLTRAIKGTYVYVVDDNLRKYFSNYIKTFK